MVTRTESQAKLAAALAKAQGAIRSAEKDATNPHLRNRYATLQSVIRATRPHLAANGLSLTCAPVFDDARAGVCWTLRHSSGEWESGTLLMPLGQGRGINPSQQCGAVISYASRYCRMHLLGCAAGDDVDAAEDKPKPKQSARPVEQGPIVDTKSPAWRSWQARLAEAGVAYEAVATWCEANDRPRPSAMTLHQWKQLCAWLDNGGKNVIQQAASNHA